MSTKVRLAGGGGVEVEQGYPDVFRLIRNGIDERGPFAWIALEASHNGRTVWLRVDAIVGLLEA